MNEEESSTIYNILTWDTPELRIFWFSIPLKLCGVALFNGKSQTYMYWSLDAMWSYDSKSLFVPPPPPVPDNICTNWSTSKFVLLKFCKPRISWRKPTFDDTTHILDNKYILYKSNGIIYQYSDKKNNSISSVISNN